MFGNLCTLQRQASHFLSVLQASRHPAVPPVANAAAPLHEHAVEEKTVKQMAERIIQAHKYGTLTSVNTCHLCTAAALHVKMLTLDSSPSSGMHAKLRRAGEAQNVHVCLLQCLLADAASHVCTGKHSPLRQGREIVARPLIPRGQWQEAMRPMSQPCGHCRCNISSPAMPLRTKIASCACFMSTPSAALLRRP